MALVIETGQVVSGADSYVDLAAADLYHADRGNTSWGVATDTDKEIALRKAAQYLDGTYLSRWKGRLLTALQPRQWPRYGVQLLDVRSFSAENYDGGFNNGLLPANIIPEQIKQAQCELAFRALTSPLAPDLSRGGKLTKLTVGPITKEFEKGAPGSTTYPIVEQLVGAFISSTNNSELVRC